MRNALAIMNRELLALFLSPIAYIVIAAFLVATGVVAAPIFEQGNTASLRGVFNFAPTILAIVIPAITMRLIAEEYRTGTIETLMTAPVNEAELVIGKFLAGMVLYVVMIAATGIYLIALMAFGEPDLGTASASYLGLFLLGAAFLAIGTFTSSLTANQIIAWILSVVPLLIFIWFMQLIISRTEGTLRDILRTIDVTWHLDRFNTGLVTSDGVIFFLVVCAYFLFMAIRVVESKRWR